MLGRFMRRSGFEDRTPVIEILVRPVVTALQFLPSLLLSLWGGLLADRFDKRKLLFLTNLGGGLGSALLGIQHSG